MNTQENLAKSFAVAENMVEKFWDMLLVGMGSVSWSQEQAESVVKKYLEQNKEAREENIKLVEEVMNQAKKNQIEIQKIVQEAVNTAVENANASNFNLFSDFNKKIDELSKKVENL